MDGNRQRDGHAPGGSVAVVTGARRGIGRATALALAARGFTIAALDVVDDERLSSLVAEIRAAGGHARGFHADIADVDRHPRIVADIVEALGPVDCLVNNAGVQVERRDGDLLATTPESFDRVMGINLRGTFFFTQAVARHMCATREAGLRTGSVITISSANAHLARSDRPEYCLSKAGLTMLNRMLAIRLAPFGIRAYEVRPGIIRTDMNRAVWERYTPAIESGLTPIARWGETGDVAETIATLASGGLPFSTGIVVDVDGGLMVPRSPLEPVPPGPGSGAHA